MKESTVGTPKDTKFGDIIITQGRIPCTILTKFSEFMDNFMLHCFF